MSIFDKFAQFANDAVGFGRAFWNKNGSVVCITCGVGATLASTVYACYKTLNAPDIIEEHKTDMAALEAEHQNDTELTINEKLPVYISTGVKFAKNYALPVIGWGVGTGLEVYGFAKERSDKKQALYALSSSLATLAAYRSRVAKVVGDENEQSIYRGDILEIVDATGATVRTIEPDDEVGDISNYGAFSIMFDNAWGSFQIGKPMLNYYKAKELEQFVTMKVRRNGMVTLNDLFEFGEHPKDKYGYKWGFAPNPGCDRALYSANFGIANAKRYENGVWGPPEDDRIDMCLPLVYIGDMLPKLSVFDRKENRHV